MQLVVYSNELFQAKNIGWQRGGENISYFPNGIINNKKSLHTLRFSYTFNYSNDTVWFAYNYPYTYSQLVDFLNRVEASRGNSE